MTPIYQDLHQFTTYLPAMDFTLHQYLLATEPAILFATGTAQQARAILPQVQALLKGRALKYIFVSHLESDECGGLSVFLQAYPQAQVLCSSLAARELPGYGLSGSLLPVSSEKRLTDGQLELQFFDYPAEVHLQNGLVCLERNSGVFYSSDLMRRFGSGGGQVLRESWAHEVASIGPASIPCGEKAAGLKAALETVRPAFVAVGHGFCVDCRP